MKLSVEEKNKLAVIRGAGDLATGVAVLFFRSGYRVVMLETARPTVIRRTVSFAQAVYDGETSVEGIRAKLVPLQDLDNADLTDFIAVVVDADCKSVETLKPEILVDAILAKKNLGTTKEMAPIVVALGPGFTAGNDCHAVVETQRGALLGKVYYSGSAIPDTGIPGDIAGYSLERVIRTSEEGIFRSKVNIGDLVKKGDTVAFVNSTPLKTVIDGKVRGMLMDGLYCPKGFKVADVDPRGEDADCYTCSDKARKVAQGTLEAVIQLLGE